MTAFRAGRFDDVVAICSEIIAGNPRDGAALHLLGLAEIRRGRSAEAVDALTRTAAVEPANAEAHGNLGVALRAAGDPAAAVESLRRAIALRPVFVPARFNLGNALSDLGRHDEAVAAYRDALALDPSHAGAHNNLGLALTALGRPADAEPHFRAALSAAPGQRDANLNLARCLRSRGDLAGALRHLETALIAAADDPTVLSERGVVLVELDRAEEGVASLRAALARAPDSADIRINLGAALCAAAAAGEALPHFEAANRLAPGSAETNANIGHALKQLGRLAEAVEVYDRALALDETNREARFGRAVCRLLKGAFSHGWPDYRARESMAQVTPGLWRETLPADLTAKRVLVLRDQGIGDELFFLRFMPALKARGAQVMYMPDPRLAGMIARSQVTSVVGSQADAGPCDYTVSVGDLPYLLDSDEPPPSIVLQPLADRIDAMRARLAAFGPPPYVGVTWRAGTRSAKGLLYKETPRTRLAHALAPIDVRVVVLQRQPRPAEVDGFAMSVGRPVLDLSALNDDLESMLALVGLLDDHVCVSNTNVHLAAACGRVCRILLPHPPEFRWMAAGAESPWFPGMRLYRQPPDSGWAGPFATLADDLAAAFAST